MFGSFPDAFEHHVASRGDAAAIVAVPRESSEPVSLTWRELSERVDAITVDDVQVVQSDNSLDEVITILAILRHGGVEVSIDSRSSQTVSSDIRVPVGTALLLFTSGTTGKPKGVMLSGDALLRNAAAKLAAVPQNPDDVRLSVLSFAHAYARTCDLGTWLLSGCTLAVSLGMDGLGKLAPIVQPTLMNVVPSIAYRLLDEELPAIGLGRLRLLGVGGAAIDGDAFDDFANRGVTVIQGYGLTETGPVICSATPNNATPGLVGDFVDGWEHDIRDGELFVRGPHLMTGYLNDDTATRAKIDARGWLRTGDRVEYDGAARQLKILGRVDDVIVLDNGFKISPGPIERDIERVAGVRHAMLVHRGTLQLWIDGDANLDHVKNRLRHHDHCGRASVHRFESPLSIASGELTAKGTLRRSQILMRLIVND